MKYQTTKPFKSLSKGGLNCPANHPVSPVSFSPETWAALLAEGAVVAIDEPKPEPETVAEKPTAVTKRKANKQ